MSQTGARYICLHFEQLSNIGRLVSVTESSLNGGLTGKRPVEVLVCIKLA